MHLCKILYVCKCFSYKPSEFKNMPYKTLENYVFHPNCVKREVLVVFSKFHSKIISSVFYPKNICTSIEINLIINSTKIGEKCKFFGAKHLLDGWFICNLLWRFHILLRLCEKNINFCVYKTWCLTLQGPRSPFGDFLCFAPAIAKPKFNILKIFWKSVCLLTSFSMH